MKTYNLEEYRIQVLKVSMVTAADTLGITKQQLNRWEKQNNYDSNSLRKICSTYGIGAVTTPSRTYFLSGKDFKKVQMFVTGRVTFNENW